MAAAACCPAGSTAAHGMRQQQLHAAAGLPAAFRRGSRLEGHQQPTCWHGVVQLTGALPPQGPSKVGNQRLCGVFQPPHRLDAVPLKNHPNRVDDACNRSGSHVWAWAGRPKRQRERRRPPGAATPLPGWGGSHQATTRRW